MVLSVGITDGQGAWSKRRRRWASASGQRH